MPADQAQPLVLGDHGGGDAVTAGGRRQGNGSVFANGPFAAPLPNWPSAAPSSAGSPRINRSPLIDPYLRARPARARAAPWPPRTPPRPPLGPSRSRPRG